MDSERGHKVLAVPNLRTNLRNRLTESVGSNTISRVRIPLRGGRLEREC